MHIGHSVRLQFFSWFQLCLVVFAFFVGFYFTLRSPFFVGVGEVLSLLTPKSDISLDLGGWKDFVGNLSWSSFTSSFANSFSNPISESERSQAVMNLGHGSSVVPEWQSANDSSSSRNEKFVQPSSSSSVVLSLDKRIKKKSKSSILKKQIQPVRNTPMITELPKISETQRVASIYFHLRGNRIASFKNPLQAPESNVLGTVIADRKLNFQEIPTTKKNPRLAAIAISGDKTSLPSRLPIKLKSKSKPKSNRSNTKTSDLVINNSVSPSLNTESVAEISTNVVVQKSVRSEKLKKYDNDLKEDKISDKIGSAENVALLDTQNQGLDQSGVRQSKNKNPLGSVGSVRNDHSDSTSVNIQSDYLSPDVSTHLTTHFNDQMNIHMDNQASGDTQIVKSSALTSALQTEHPSMVQNEQAVIKSCEFKGLADRKFVTAFSWAFPVDGVVSKSYTNEFFSKRSCYSGGWEIFDAGPRYLKTIVRSPATRNIPFIDLQALKMIAFSSGNEYHFQTGVVFGKIPKGWLLNFLGRSEKPLYFDSENIPILSDNINLERYFLLLNVEPGVGLLKLREPNRNIEGSFALLSNPGVSSYIDLTEIYSMHLSGRVLDATQNKTKGTGQVTVQIIEQSQSLTVSDPHGYFSFPNLVTAPGFATFIETNSEDGFTHRYQVRADLENEVTLYRLPSTQIQEWIGHLAGGISDQSGIIVGAFPTLTAIKENQPLSAAIGTFVDPPLIPQIFGLTASGDLKSDSVVSSESHRLLGVQISEGNHILELTDLSQKQIWSELIVSSPNVINMVGPY